MRIDAHQHFWQPARGDYDWMPMDNPTLARVYGPVDLAPHLDRHGIDATVIVQAAASVEETAYMLGIADATPWVAGVVGWVDFEDASQHATLARLAQHPKFVGVRPMIQDIPDVNWMLRADVQWAFGALSDLDLSFDALGFPPHLDNFLTIRQRYPDLRMVVDHCMKPAVPRPEGFDTWARGMTALADAGAWCKLSGLVTEAGPDWTAEDLLPYMAHVIDAFGPERVMFGSDWPVCRLAAHYDQWMALVEVACKDLSEAGRARILGGSAAAFYKLAV